MADYARTEYWGSGTLIPEIESCGRSSQREARPGLMMHRHRQAFEITLINRGEVEWAIASRVVVASTGDIIITKPGEWHGSVGSVVHRCELYWFRIIDRPGDGNEQLLADLAALQIRHLAASPALARSIRGVLHEHQRRDQHAAVAARALAHDALVRVVREAALAPPQSLSDPVQQALDWMADRVGEPFLVSEVAAAVNLSLVRLEARFGRELHYSIGEHRTRIRVHRAKLLLANTDHEITAIAHSLAFSSSQYFATVFRQRVGVTPSQYRAQVRAGHGTVAVPATAPTDDEAAGKRAMRAQLTSEVKRLFIKHHGGAGPAEITAELRETGWRVGCTTVARVMRDQHLSARSGATTR